MKGRIFAAVIASLLLACQAARAADSNVHEGLVLKAGDGKLLIADVDGPEPRVFTVGPAARIMCDGEVCKLEDLKVGYFVRVTTMASVVTDIAANKKPPPEDLDSFYSK